MEPHLSRGSKLNSGAFQLYGPTILLMGYSREKCI